MDQAAEGVGAGLRELEGVALLRVEHARALDRAAADDDGTALRGEHLRHVVRELRLAVEVERAAGCVVDPRICALVGRRHEDLELARLVRPQIGRRVELLALERDRVADVDDHALWEEQVRVGGLRRAGRCGLQEAGARPDRHVRGGRLARESECRHGGNARED